MLSFSYLRAFFLGALLFITSSFTSYNNPQLKPLPASPLAPSQIEAVPQSTDLNKQALVKPSERFEVRAAVDIGSGATKLRVAEVDLQTNKIEKILINTSFPVNYQEQLEHSPTQSFDEAIMNEGLMALKASKEIANKYQAQNVVAVATAAFRNAKNATAFMEEIKKQTGINVYVIDQELEGRLAFEATSIKSPSPASNLLVWDVGGGSLQLTLVDPNDKNQLRVYLGNQASIYFRNHMIQEIQRQDFKNTSTPNPMKVEEIQQGLFHARAVAKKVDQIFKDKIQDPRTQLIGVGNIFAYGIYPLLGNKATFNQEELRVAVMNLAGKTDADMGGGAFANVAISNAIMVLGFMETLGIHEMQIMDINTADGALVYPEFWDHR